MTREDLIYSCTCPICEEVFTAFADLYGHLIDHCDEDIMIAEDFLEEAMRLAAEEEIEEE